MMKITRAATEAPISIRKIPNRFANASGSNSVPRHPLLMTIRFTIYIKFCFQTYLGFLNFVFGPYIVDYS